MICSLHWQNQVFGTLLCGSRSPAVGLSWWGKSLQPRERMLGVTSGLESRSSECKVNQQRHQRLTFSRSLPRTISSVSNLFVLFTRPPQILPHVGVSPKPLEPPRLWLYRACHVSATGAVEGRGLFARAQSGRSRALWCGTREDGLPAGVGRGAVGHLRVEAKRFGWIVFEGMRLKVEAKVLVGQGFW